MSLYDRGPYVPRWVVLLTAGAIVIGGLYWSVVWVAEWIERPL